MPEKILVVDDDVDSLRLIKLMLERHGYEVTAANTGTQAIARANADHPNLIILDVMMPDMSGYDVCRRLRATPATQAIPIIMFTAKTLIDDKVAGFEAGADDYLTKPTHPAELASRVRAILARSASQRRQQSGNTGATIGVIGAKGGVGTTTLALNIGAAMVLKGENPVVADFRLGSGVMGLSLGFGRAQGMANLLSKSAAEIQPRTIEEEIVTHQSGLRVLLSSIRVKEAQTNYSLESALALIRGLRAIARPAVFDLGSTLNAMTTRLQREMDQIVLVVEPLAPTLAIAREMIQELDAGRTGTSRVHVVVVNRNQSGMQTPWPEVEQTLGQELRAIIFAAPDLAYQAVQSGVPIVMFQPSAMVSNQIIKLADALHTRIQALSDGKVTT